MKTRFIMVVILSLLFLNLLAAEFDLNRFIDPAKYGWDDLESYQSFREEMDLRKNLLQIYSIKKMNVRNNILQSMVLPGLGHYRTKNYMKGHVFLAAEIILWGTSFYYYDQAMDKYDKYKKATYIIDINNYYEDAQKPFRNFKIFAGLGLAVWLYNIFDTWQVTEDYNNNVWEGLYKSYKSGNIFVTPTGISVRF